MEQDPWGVANEECDDVTAKDASKVMLHLSLAIIFLVQHTVHPQIVSSNVNIYFCVEVNQACDWNQSRHQ